MKWRAGGGGERVGGGWVGRCEGLNVKTTLTSVRHFVGVSRSSIHFEFFGPGFFFPYSNFFSRSGRSIFLLVPFIAFPF